MVRLNKIYTPLAVAIGDVDEANSAIGIAVLHVADADVGAMLQRIQNEMFDLGADLATPGEEFAPTDRTLRIVQAQIDRLEAEVDRMNEALEPLRSFILPGAPSARRSPHRASGRSTRWR